MKLIYLHLYKDTYLIFMQVYKYSRRNLNNPKSFKKRNSFTFQN